eukprot:1367654-Amorphochlora_amoeboformis.AAC.2
MAEGLYVSIILQQDFSKPFDRFLGLFFVEIILPPWTELRMLFPNNRHHGSVVEPESPEVFQGLNRDSRGSPVMRESPRDQSLAGISERPPMADVGGTASY